MMGHVEPISGVWSSVIRSNRLRMGCAPACMAAFGDIDPVRRSGLDRQLLSDPANRNIMATQAKVALSCRPGVSLDGRIPRFSVLNGSGAGPSCPARRLQLLALLSDHCMEQVEADEPLLRDGQRLKHFLDDLRERVPHRFI